MLLWAMGYLQNLGTWQTFHELACLILSMSATSGVLVHDKSLKNDFLANQKGREETKTTIEIVTKNASSGDQDSSIIISRVFILVICQIMDL